MQTQIIQPEKRIYIPCQHEWQMRCDRKGYFCIKCRKLWMGREDQFPPTMPPKAIGGQRGILVPGGGGVIGGGGVPIVVGDPCDSCTGTLIFSAHFENNDDITLPSVAPCGCSTNATKSFTLSGATYSTTQKSDGTYSLYRNAGNQYATIPTTDNRAEGTITFDLYVTASGEWMTFIVWLIDGNNYLYIQTTSDALAINAEIKGSGGDGTTDSVTGSFTRDAWHSITVKWKATDPYMYMKVDTTETTGGNGHGVITGTWPVMRIGGTADTTNVFYIDNLKIYNTYL